jgi:hypothetical protein
MTGTNFSSWYNQAAGTLYADFKPNNGANSRAAIFGLLQGSTFYCGSRYDLNGTSLRFLAGAVGETLTAIGNTKAAFTIKPNDFSFVVNASSPQSVASSAFVQADIFYIGQYPVGGVAQLNGHIRKLSYYPLRLQDAELQALTT